MMINTMCVFGTRPEAIKMAPLIKKLESTHGINNRICVTGQHNQMLKEVLSIFSLIPDINMNVMEPNQQLGDLTSKILSGLGPVYRDYNPDIVLVHGDTTTALAASLAAYYNQIPIMHIEAGLRTGNLYSPWPEEANRKLIGSLASLHFAPTSNAKLNLQHEGIDSEKIFVTGNTVIDALQEISAQLTQSIELQNMMEQKFSYLDSEKKIILVTGHRRENFGLAFDRISEALIEIANKYPQVDIVFPVHLNPNVKGPAYKNLDGYNNIYLIPPLDYLSFVYLMNKSYLILTDSGGIQEEAPALGKPVLLMRESTERPEAVLAGTVKLVGSNAEVILSAVEELLLNNQQYLQMSQAPNPYGDGRASERIVKEIINAYVKAESELEPIVL